uniref:interferon-induced transmembrane protein 1-like n=1 Tax=Myxine glutinosa TaxID=7769 RepID=UPI00358EC9EE
MSNIQMESTLWRRSPKMKMQPQGPYDNDPPAHMHPQRPYTNAPPAHMHPQGPQTGFVNTSVNISQNSAPTPGMKTPTDYLAWSLFNFVFLNGFCLGYVATVYSIRSRDRRQMNDPVGAAEHASTARALNIAATVISSFILLIAIILVGVFVAAWVHLIYSVGIYDQFSNSGFHVPTPDPYLSWFDK